MNVNLSEYGDVLVSSGEFLITLEGGINDGALRSTLNYGIPHWEGHWRYMDTGTDDVNRIRIYRYDPPAPWS